MKQPTFYAIIVAGGAGKRMNSVLPKQFLTIAGKPILMHTIEKFHKCDYHPKITLVLAANDLEIWNQKIKEFDFKIPHSVVAGGSERFHSVKNGLDAIKEHHAFIAIHDAVRPLVSFGTINNGYENAMLNGNAITAISSKDSIRIADSEKNYAIPRNQVYLVQTPQTFSYNQLETAYKQEFSNDFTDDASVVEKAGFEIFLQEGDQFNIKITYEEDLILAEALLQNQI
jgi:2-C-methyl-D-erythritol 4-phosphate cytidylyltransferase